MVAALHKATALQLIYINQPANMRMTKLACQLDRMEHKKQPAEPAEHSGTSP